MMDVMKTVVNSLVLTYSVRMHLESK